MFGSDWPHGEGKPKPKDYLADTSDLDAAQLERFMRTNAADLLGVRPPQDRPQVNESGGRETTTPIE